MVNNWRKTEPDAENTVRRIFDDLGGFTVEPQQDRGRRAPERDLVIRMTSAQVEFQLAIDVKARVTPQTAISVCERMRRLPSDLIPVIYAPVISPRVAEILEQFGVGFIDQAGNCRLRSTRHGLLIDRRGYKPTARPAKGTADPFSFKSSRIVRALLTRPGKGWLAPEVRYNVAAVYVDSHGFDREMLDRLGSYQGGKPVETGANLLLWRPYDRSALAGGGAENDTGEPVTSAIQTYLDLKRMAGRGEAAAAAVYERQLVRGLREAAERVKEMHHAEL